MGRWLSDMMVAVPPALAYLVVAVVATAESLFLGLVRTSRLGRRIGPARWARVEKALADRGARAILFGRLVGVLADDVRRP